MRPAHGIEALEFDRAQQRERARRLANRPVSHERAQFVERALSLYRRPTDEIAALSGMTEAEVWNSRARMDAIRRRR